MNYKKIKMLISDNFVCNNTVPADGKQWKPTDKIARTTSNVRG